MCSILSFKVKEQIIFFLLVAISQTQKTSTELRTHTHTHTEHLWKNTSEEDVLVCACYVTCDFPEDGGGVPVQRLKPRILLPFDCGLDVG